MVDATQRPKLGPYILMRPLAEMGLATRWLALHELTQSSHVIYRFPVCHDNSERRRFLSAVRAASAVSHPHILKVEQFAFDPVGGAWVVTPYMGDIEGIMHMSRLLRAKGGSMSPSEAGRAVEQLLEASATAHAAKLHHGPVRMEDVLVDRHGSLVVELYGMSRLLRGLTIGNEELVRDEVRSIVEIGYQLITALRAEEPLIPAGRLVKKLDPRWDAWFDTGLDPTSGFATAADALAALPSKPLEPVASGAGVRSVINMLGIGRR
jgi:serine/threonine protein kinase